jgi:antitoxin (DNA-binding transcriptional repressor) of toxin-antitoxin stability system
MSVRVPFHQLQEQLQELLDRTVQSGEECVIQRDGEDYAVIVSAREWQRHGRTGEAAPSTATRGDAADDRVRAIGRQLDALGPEYRLAGEKQERLEELLDKESSTPLAPAERAELEALAAECDEIMLRRAQALPRIL